MKAIPSMRQLRYLIAVSEEGHFGRAAETCFVTQSTLSAGIQDLEDLLGVILIERTKRRVSMTPLGLDIVARARRIIREAEEITDAAKAGAEPLSGDLRLGVIPTIGPYLMPQIQRKLHKAFPRLRLYLREEQSKNCVSMMQKGLLDVIILALPYPVEGLECMKLADDGLVVACPKGHDLTTRKRVDEGLLASEPLMLLEDGHCLRDHALESCPLVAGARNEVFQATSVNTLVQMVANGLGITLLPEMAVPVEAGKGTGVVTIPITGAKKVREIALCWRKGTVRADEYRKLGEVFKNHLAGH